MDPEGDGSIPIPSKGSGHNAADVIKYISIRTRKPNAKNNEKMHSSFGLYGIVRRRRTHI